MKETTILEADICCPKCKHKFIVRSSKIVLKDDPELNEEVLGSFDKVFESMDGVFSNMDKLFGKIFKR